MKQFDDWNQLKKTIEKNPRPLFFRERQVWLCHYGENVGTEQCGRGKKFLRPVLILKKFNRNMAYCVPLTSKNKDGHKGACSLLFKKQPNWLLLQQMKLIDSRRFISHVGSISEQRFIGISQQLQNIFLYNYKQEPKAPVDSLMAKCEPILNQAKNKVKPQSIFLDQLFNLIKDRQKNRPPNSYVTRLFDDGLDRVAQKVGEEGVETVIAAKNDHDDEFIGEAADLLFHLQVLCAARNIEWSQIIEKLKSRHQK